MLTIFEPFRIGGLELRNRFVRSATWDGMADGSGAVTDASVAMHRQLAEGGVGLIITGLAFVSTQGQAVHGQYGVHTDEMLPGLRRLVETAHRGRAKIALQVAHSGMGSDYLLQKGEPSLAVSQMPRLGRPHREMTEEDIETILSQFASAALRAREAGFDAVQIHGAHGYLLSQFLSPRFNRRTDRWGGDLSNRRRFHLELVERVRHAVGPGFPLLIKFGVQDDKGGLTLDEGIETAKLTVQRGGDGIEVSVGVGTAMRVKKADEPENAFFRDWASAVKQAVSVPVIAVGGIRSLEMARSIVESGDADLVALSRPFIREPDLIARWQRGDTRPADCISCNKCLVILAKGEPLRCGQKDSIQ